MLIEGVTLKEYKNVYCARFFYGILKALERNDYEMGMRLAGTAVLDGEASLISPRLWRADSMRTAFMGMKEAFSDGITTHEDSPLFRWVCVAQELGAVVQSDLNRIDNAKLILERCRRMSQGFEEEVGPWVTLCESIISINEKIEARKTREYIDDMMDFL